MILVLGACTMLLLDRLMERYLARRRRRDRGIAVITFWLALITRGTAFASRSWCTSSRRFGSRSWSSPARACGSASRAGAPYSTRRRDDIRLLLPILALATSMAIVCRPTNVFVAPFIVWALAGVVRAGKGGKLLRALPIALAAGLLPLAAQAAVWRAMYGSWLYYSYGGERFVWTQPALLQTLFGWHKGIFHLVATAAGRRRRIAPRIPSLPGAPASGDGRLLARRCRHPLVPQQRLVVLGLRLVVWGARVPGSSAGMFVLGLALLFEWLRRQPLPAQKLAALLLVALVGYNYVLMGLYQIHRIDRGDWRTGGWTRAGAPTSFLEHVEKHRHAQLESGEP
jgi:hypothetical protein